METEFLKIAEMIFPDYKNDFSDFYNLYLSNRKKFLTQKIFLSKDIENFDLKHLKPIEVLYIFADSKNLVHLIDWRGEENEREIEAFIDRLIKQKHPWTHTSKLRNGLNEEKQRDGKFIIDLFRSLDKDLQAIGKSVFFFELNWDAYVYTVIASKTLDEIEKKSLNDFHGVDKLRK